MHVDKVINVLNKIENNPLERLNRLSKDPDGFGSASALYTLTARAPVELAVASAVVKNALASMELKEIVGRTIDTVV